MNDPEHLVPKSRMLVMCAWLFSALFCFFAIVAPMGNIPSDTEYSIATAESLVHRHSLNIDKSEKLRDGIDTKNHGYRSRYGIGYAASFIPCVLFTDAIAKISHVNKENLLQFLVSFTNTFYAACICVLFFLLFVRLGYSLQHSLTATLLIACASILFPYSKIIHSEILATLCLLILLNMVAHRISLTLKNGFALGCIVSALYLLKIGNMPLAVIVASYAVIRIIQRKATIAGAFTFSLASIIPFLLMLVSNNNDYGSFSNFGYGAEQRQFTTPVANGLAGFFFSPSKSLFLFSPLIIICITGIKPLLTKQTMVAVYAIVFFITDVLFYACWHDWHGGWCFGPRLIVPVLIVVHVFLPEAIKIIRISVVNKLLFVIILVCALAINCLGSLVCYQEMYYFHTDYTSVSQSHPVIDARLLAHKLAGKPEYYSLADMNVSRMQTVYRNTWPTLIKGNAVDLTSFKTFRGLATMWCGLSENFGWTWALFVPVFLFGATMFCLRRVQFIFQEKTPNSTTLF